MAITVDIKCNNRAAASKIGSRSVHNIRWTRDVILKLALRLTCKTCPTLNLQLNKRPFIAGEAAGAKHHAYGLIHKHAKPGTGKPKAKRVAQQIG